MALCLEDDDDFSMKKKNDTRKSKAEDNGLIYYFCQFRSAYTITQNWVEKVFISFLNDTSDTLYAYSVQETSHNL